MICCGAKPASAEDVAATAALLDEIVAGDDANTALIQYGTASYAITQTHWRYSFAPGRELGDPPNGPGEEHRPFDADLTVYFDYPRLRFEWRGNGVVQGDDASVYEECTIRDGERTIDVNLPQFPGKSITGRGFDPPIKASQLRAANVIIHLKQHQRRRMIDPRQQQTAPSLAGRIRSKRARSRVLFASRIGCFRPGRNTSGWWESTFPSVPTRSCLRSTVSVSPRAPEFKTGSRAAITSTNRRRRNEGTKEGCARSSLRSDRPPGSRTEFEDTNVCRPWWMVNRLIRSRPSTRQAV